MRVSCLHPKKPSQALLNLGTIRAGPTGGDINCCSVTYCSLRYVGSGWPDQQEDTAQSL